MNPPELTFGFTLAVARAMIDTTVDLMTYFHPTTAFTESDEITLIFPPAQSSSPPSTSSSSTIPTSSASASSAASAAEMNDEKQEQREEEKATTTTTNEALPYNGRVLKLATLASSYCSVRFNHRLAEQGKESKVCADKAATASAFFDCRVFNVPTMDECWNNLVWRCRDSKRNSKTGWGRSFMSAKEMKGIASDRVVAFIAEKHGKHWDSLAGHFKWGTIIKKVLVKKQGIDHKGQPVEFTRGAPFYCSMDLKFSPEFVRMLTTKHLESSFMPLFKDTPFL